MTKREKYLERILILRTLINYGPQVGIDLADRASAECDHESLEELAPISRRAIGQKLSAMSLDGLVYGMQAVRFAPFTWTITDRGRKVVAQFGAEETSA